MSLTSFYIIIGAYVAALFAVAYFTLKHRPTYRRLSRKSWIYALTLVIYCTAWTFYGSIGNAGKGGFSYIGVYLGPTLLAPLWGMVLVKMIRIAKHQRITSIADFISARYGKSSKLGILISLFSVIIIIPYISIQLKALTFSSKIITDGVFPAVQSSNQAFYLDPAFGFALAFGIFATVFGTIKLDPNEKHPGLVHAIAFESIVKIIAFLLGAICIVWFVFDGMSDIFTQLESTEWALLFSQIGEPHLSYSSWVVISLLSGIAFLLLPRQFHMAVVENRNVEHVYQATWMVPLYLLVISLLVIPVTGAGKLIFGTSLEADTFLLAIPLEHGYNLIGLVVFIGGLAAASGMLIVSLLSLSIMLSNNVLLPLLLKYQTQFDFFLQDLNRRLLELRRVAIFIIAILAYAFYQIITVNYSLVSVGLISFAGVAQFAPIFFLGMYWKKATSRGAIIGLISGMLIWMYCLPFAELLRLGYFNSDWLTYGPFHLSFLKPHALFGLNILDSISHGVFWSLSINILLFVGVSLLTKPSSVELAQADIFLHPEKYLHYRTSQLSPIRREASFSDLHKVLADILSEQKVQSMYVGFFGKKITKPFPDTADSDLINYVETYLTGAIGSASTKIVLDYVVVHKPINVTELIEVLDQTHQVMEYSRALQDKTKELNLTADELRSANDQLMQLDVMKNEFISNVTHELRTPLTSIRSLAQTMLDYELTDQERKRFLEIIQGEAKRVGLLVNQVLDLRKLDREVEVTHHEINLEDMVSSILDLMQNQKENREIKVKLETSTVQGDGRMVKQILINLVQNAIKFTDSEKGVIQIDARQIGDRQVIVVEDNGIGIDVNDQEYIFNRFYQVRKAQLDKPKGSGLGLSICKKYMELMGGHITLESALDEGSTFTLSWPISPESLNS